MALYLRRDAATPIKTATRLGAGAQVVAAAAASGAQARATQAGATRGAAAHGGVAATAAANRRRRKPPTPPPAAAEAPAQDEAPPEKPKPSKQPVADAQSRSDARNPWQQPVPRELKSIRDRVNRGVHVSQKALKPAYAYAHENPGDPRPWLLLGRAYAQVDWYTDSVERYVRAHREDSTCRGDPHMLTDLLAGAAHPTAGRNAARAIREIYGAEALPALEKAMERRAGNREATARLARLRDSLLQ